MENKITFRDLVDITDKLLNFAEERRINSIQDLERLCGSRTVLGDTGNEFIEIQRRPGGKLLLPTSLPITVSYVINGKGTPVEVRINTEEGYSMFIVKVDGNIEGYNPFVRDHFGNLIQSYRFILTNLQGVFGKLKELRSYLCGRLN